MAWRPEDLAVEDPAPEDDGEDVPADESPKVPMWTDMTPPGEACQDTPCSWGWEVLPWP